MLFGSINILLWHDIDSKLLFYEAIELEFYFAYMLKKKKKLNNYIRQHADKYNHISIHNKRKYKRSLVNNYEI